MVQQIDLKLRQMRLTGMSRGWLALNETKQVFDLSFSEGLEILLQREEEERKNNRFNRLIIGARFRYQASMEQIDYTEKRELDKAIMLRLSSGDWITKKQNVIITGATGLGKSFLSSALGHQACQQGYKVFYRNSGKLFDELKIAKADGSYIKEISKIETQDLLIIDDFGLKPLDNVQRLILLEVLEDRHGKKSTLITSQVPVNKWYDIIGEPTIADYPHYFIMRSNIMVCVVNHQLSCPNSTIYFA